MLCVGCQMQRAGVCALGPQTHRVGKDAGHALRIELNYHTLALRKALVAIVPSASKLEMPHEGRELIAH